MSTEFSIKLSVRDLYLFNLHHTYTSLKGLFTIIIGIFLVVILAIRSNDLGSSTLLFYGALVLAYLLYNPIILYLRSKQRIFASEVLSQPLSYAFKDDGIWVSSPAVEGEESLPWDSIYKVTTTKNYLYIFSNTVNAYIIPKNQVSAQLDEILSACQSRVEKYRLNIKR